MIQCFLPYKAAVEARKAAPDKEIYNDYAWNPLLDRMAKPENSQVSP